MRKWLTTTQWPLVIAAAESDHPEGREALAELCRIYWWPVYAFVRHRGHPRDAAEDLTQAFFTRFLEKGYVRQVRRERGRFRSFLFVCLKHFLANEWDRVRARRRGGDQPLFALDFDAEEDAYRPEPADPTTPEDVYVREWATALLRRTMRRLGEEMIAGGNAERFRRLSGYLTGDDSGSTYREVGRDLALSEAAVKVAVHRMRRRFGELLREEVSRTVETAEEIDAEIQYIFQALGR
jgi:RNA polymerase sigma factor (sigma-70 family)